MSSTRAPRISNSICSPRMTGTSSTTPSPPTWRSRCPPCMTIGGRGAQEKTFAELKGEFALAVVPTKHYGANSAWQQLSILAYNVARSFQLDTGAAPRRRSRKRTYTYVLRSMRTLRFTLVARAGRLARIGGRQVLRLTFNPATAALYTRLQPHPSA